MCDLLEQMGRNVRVGVEMSNPHWAAAVDRFQTRFWSTNHLDDGRNGCLKAVSRLAQSLLRER